MKTLSQDEIFKRFSPYIRDFIYKNGWEELREVQCRAASILFGSEDNLLITSPTASGKTEAALFPILSMLENRPSDSVDILYVAPLKSLINDQFARLDSLLEGHMPAFHWHGDVSSGAKEKFLKEPRGILQITPESLESMLLHRSQDIPRIFGSACSEIDGVHDVTVGFFCPVGKLVKADFVGLGGEPGKIKPLRPLIDGTYTVLPTEA